MRLFEVEKYELPSVDRICWKDTKINVGIFLSVYKTARERVGLSVLPKLTGTYQLVNEEHKRIQLTEELINYEDYRIEFIRLNKLFILGYSSIMHPYRPEVTERRRKVFMLRYVYGLTVPIISERVNYQKNIIIEDSKNSMIQFAQSLELLEKKSTFSQPL